MISAIFFILNLIQTLIRSEYLHLYMICILIFAKLISEADSIHFNMLKI